MSHNSSQKFIWECGYMMLITVIICFLAFFLSHLSLPAVSSVFFMNLAGVIILWLKPLSRHRLYFLNILNCITATTLAYLVIALVINSPDSFYTMIIIIIVMDIFSFTKAGKRTANARLTGNVNTLARLSICLPVPHNSGLQPIIGLGDLYFYSILFLFFLHHDGVPASFWSIFLILVGQTANILLISIIRNKAWYKGFPATAFPGIFCLIYFI